MSGSNESPWYAGGLAFECAACGGCCGGFPGYVWVSDEEADSIAELLGLGRDEFLADYCARADGRYTIRELGGEEKWDCVMLEDGRCRIYEARPVQCRTFPFWNENLRSHRAWDLAARKCPGMNTGRVFSPEEIERRRR